MRRVTAVRPYDSRIRRRVFAVLERAGLVIEESDIVPKGTSDADVLQMLRDRPPGILLIPFHAHRDDHGANINGVAFAERLAAVLPSLSEIPILMPASTVALPGAELMLSPFNPRPLSDDLRSRILLLDESALDQPETVAAIRHHVGEVG